MASYFLNNEITQMRQQSFKDYWTNFWNYIDIIPLILMIVLIILKVLEHEEVT